MFVSKAITIIDFWLAPVHIIIMGPSATLGSEFNIVRNGSRISAINLFRYMIILITKAIIVPIKNATNTSLKVTNIWLKSSPLFSKSIRVVKILDGEENIKEFINPVSAAISHRIRRARTAIT